MQVVVKCLLSLEVQTLSMPSLLLHQIYFEPQRSAVSYQMADFERSCESSQPTIRASVLPDRKAAISADLQSSLLWREFRSSPPPQGGGLRIDQGPEGASASPSSYSQYPRIPTSYLRTIFIDNNKERVGRNIDFNINFALRVVQCTFDEPSDRELCFSKETRHRLVAAALTAEEQEGARANISEDLIPLSLVDASTQPKDTSLFPPLLKKNPSRAQLSPVPPPSLPTLPAINIRPHHQPSTARQSLTANRVVEVSRPSSAKSEPTQTQLVPGRKWTDSKVSNAVQQLRNIAATFPSKSSQFISTVRGMYGPSGPAQDTYHQSGVTTVDGLRRLAANMDPPSDSDEEGMEVHGLQKALVGWQRGQEDIVGDSNYGGTANSLARILKKNEKDSRETLKGTVCPHCDLSRNDPPLYQLELDPSDKIYQNAFKKNVKEGVDYGGLAAIDASSLSTQTSRLRKVDGAAESRHYGNLPLGALTPDGTEQNLWHALHLLRPPEELQVNAHAPSQQPHVPRLTSDEWSVLAARHFTRYVGVPPWQEYFIRLKRDSDHRASVMKHECEKITQRIRAAQAETDRVKVRTRTLERILDLRNPTDERVRLKTQLNATQQELVLRKWEVEESTRRLERDRQTALRAKANTVIFHEEIRRTVAQITDMVEVMVRLDLLNHGSAVTDARTRTFAALSPLNLTPGAGKANGGKQQPPAQQCPRCLLLTSSSPFCTVTGDPHQPRESSEHDDALMSSSLDNSYADASVFYQDPIPTNPIDFKPTEEVAAQELREDDDEEDEETDEESDEEESGSSPSTAYAVDVGSVHGQREKEVERGTAATASPTEVRATFTSDLSNFDPSRGRRRSRKANAAKGAQVEPFTSVYKEVNAENDRKPKQTIKKGSGKKTIRKQSKKTTTKKPSAAQAISENSTDVDLGDGKPLSHVSAPQVGSTVELGSSEVGSESSTGSKRRNQVAKPGSRRSTYWAHNEYNVPPPKLPSSPSSSSSSSTPTPSDQSSASLSEDENEETVVYSGNDAFDDTSAPPEVISPTTPTLLTMQTNKPDEGRGDASSSRPPPVTFSPSTANYLTSPVDNSLVSGKSTPNSVSQRRAPRSSSSRQQAAKPPSKVPLEVMSAHITKFLAASADKDFNAMRTQTRHLQSSPLYTHMFTDSTIRLLAESEEQFYAWFSVVGRPPPISCTELPSWQSITKRLKETSPKILEQKIIGLKREVRNLQYAFQKRPKGRGGGAVLDDQSFAVLALKISELEKKNATLKVRIRQANELKIKLTSQRINNGSPHNM